VQTDRLPDMEEEIDLHCSDPKDYAFLLNQGLGLKRKKMDATASAELENFCKLLDKRQRRAVSYQQLEHAHKEHIRNGHFNSPRNHTSNKSKQSNL
jgi:hypothetical protein